MPNQKSLTLLVVTSAAVFAFLSTASPAFGASEKVLYSFCPHPAAHCPDGRIPSSGVTFDTAGNLYGTTSEGGASRNGIVFELIPNNGKWTEKILHNFTGDKGGSRPNTTLILDASGNLYGTTYEGGLDDCPGYQGCGTVFELMPGTNGKWTLKVLHAFTGKDGFEPEGNLILDSAGNLYGTTSASGQYLAGLVFELIPGKNGQWTEKVLHSFNRVDGAGPAGGMVMDTAGNLYGTTAGGGTYSEGTVYELIPNNGKWTEKVLHSFDRNGKDGALPFAGVIQDNAGNLYGTTAQGGTYDSGIVFELALNNGKWAEKVLYTFSPTGYEYGTLDGVVFGKTGDLYGTTTGGTYGYGTVFELMPSNGKWIEKVLHNFGKGTDGLRPSSLITDTAGNIYGTTTGGGTYDGGTVFEITP
jgi:uncharacterized repeat protein (TIGR03803 family)